MRFLQKVKDGGPNSPVDAYFLIEIKSLFSIALLKFNLGGREAFHSHAFNALTWFICGALYEIGPNKEGRKYKRSIIPKVTPRSQTHRVVAVRDSWVFTIRGPWSSYWTEYNPNTGKTIVLTHGRRVINTKSGG